MADSRAQHAAVEPELHIVVPVYDEAENFRPFYESLVRQVRTPFELLVVYDREEDTTLPVAREIASQDGRVQLVRNEGRGVLGALKTGLGRPRSGAVLVTMADLSDDHGCVDAMFALYQQGFAVVSASRYAPGGAQRGGPRVKGLLSRTAGVSLRLLAGIPTWDATNSFKLYSREFLDAVDIESSGGFELALELTVKAHLQGRRIAELPTVWTERIAGRSRFQLRKWLPHYLRWYLLGLRGRLASLRPRV